MKVKVFLLCFILSLSVLFIFIALRYNNTNILADVNDIEEVEDVVVIAKEPSEADFAIVEAIETPNSIERVSPVKEIMLENIEEIEGLEQDKNIVNDENSENTIDKNSEVEVVLKNKNRDLDILETTDGADFEIIKFADIDENNEENSTTQEEVVEPPHVELTQEQRDFANSFLEYNFEYEGSALTLPAEFTEEDLRILATMVFWECGRVQNDITVYFYDDYETPYILPCHAMHQWTAQVCLNHLKDPRMPNNIYDDMCGPRYAPEYRTEEWTYRAKTESPEVWEDVVRDCLMAMNGLVQYPEGLIFQSNFEELGTHFATVDVDTGWWQSRSFFSIG